MASNSHSASVEYAKDFRYFGNENYPVRPTKAKISLAPVVGGKLIKFILSAVTDQVIFGGEIVSYFSVDGVEVGSQNFSLSDGVISLPISVGDFELNFIQVLPVDVTPVSHPANFPIFDLISTSFRSYTPPSIFYAFFSKGTYNLKMTLLNQDGCQLSCFAFDYTIPFDRTICYPVIDP